jgi:hypothetical protein
VDRRKNDTRMNHEGSISQAILRFESIARESRAEARILRRISFNF